MSTYEQLPVSQLPLESPGYGDVVVGNHGGINGAGGTTSIFPVTSLYDVSITLRYDGTVASGTTMSAIIDRYPLPFSMVPIAIAVVCGACTATFTWNIALGEVALTGPAVTNTIATDGQTMFSFTSPPSINAPSVVHTPGVYAANVTYPVADELTLRMATPSGTVTAFVAVIYGNIVNL